MYKLFEETMEGSKITVTVNYLETNEKPTRLFLRREKQLSSSKHINMLTKSDRTNAVSNADIKEECSHLIRNLVENTNDKNMSAAIISLDQSKALEKISHGYLFNVLRNFGFKSHLYHWLNYDTQV